MLRSTRPRLRRVRTLLLPSTLLLALTAGPAHAQAAPTALAAEAVEHLYDWHGDVRRDPAAFGLTAGALGSLQPDEELAQLAQASALSMSESGVLQHDPTIDLAARNGSTVGNNIGRSGPGVQNSADVRAALDRLGRAWLASDGHRRQIVERDYSHIGIGVAVDGDGTVWATVVFRRLPAAGAASIPARPRAPLGIDAACPAPRAHESPRFRDVTGTHRHAVECLNERGVIQGRTATTFAPDRELSQAQVAMLLDRLLTDLEVPLPTPDEAPFSDVDLDSTAGPAIARLAAAGILPQQQERFMPGDTVTRGELAVLLDAAMSVLETGHTGVGTPSFRDVLPSAEHAEAIGRVAEVGLLVGTSDGRFEPHAGLRRDHGAAAVARLLALHLG